MKHNRLPEVTCRECGKVVDSASSLVADLVPKPGDVALCLYCGHISVYAADLTMREPTPGERAEIDQDPEVMQHSQALHDYWFKEQIKTRTGQ